MRKLLVGFAVLVVATLGAVRPVGAQVSIAIGVPGFGLYVGAPYYPPPVVYGPPIAYAPPVYGPQVVYAPAPVYYRPPGYCTPRYYGAQYQAHDNGLHRGWYKHGHH